MAKFLMLNGPNLNLLGLREPAIYGAASLDDINTMLKSKAQEAGHDISFFQSNHEGALVDAIHMAHNKVDVIIFNAGAYSHTSLAVRDALLGINIPFIEVHLSNIYARETFRQHSYLSDIAIGIISGFGMNSYVLALQAASLYIGNQHKQG